MKLKGDYIKKYRKVNAESEETTHYATFTQHSLVNFIYHISFQRLESLDYVYHDCAHENSIADFEEFIKNNNFMEIK